MLNRDFISKGYARLPLVCAVAVLAFSSSLSALAQSRSKEIPDKIASTVKQIDSIDKLGWTKIVDISTDRGSHMSFYGKSEGLHRIRLWVGLSNSDCTYDYYFSGENLIFVSKRNQIVIDYVDDGKEIHEIHQLDPNYSEFRLGFQDGKVVYESRKGDYFEGEIAALEKLAHKEATELNAVSEKDSTVDLEHWQQ